MTDFGTLHSVELGGKVAVVTGAGPGLGTTLSRLLADAGATVVDAARTAREIPGATVLTRDVTSVADLRDLGNTMIETYLRLRRVAGDHRRDARRQRRPAVHLGM